MEKGGVCLLIQFKDFVLPVTPSTLYDIQHKGGLPDVRKRKQKNNEIIQQHQFSSTVKSLKRVGSKEGGQRL